LYVTATGIGDFTAYDQDSPADCMLGRVDGFQ
jgi:hypothetical protein